MPKGTVVEHKNGNVKLHVPFDAGASDYKFYTNDVGSGDADPMIERTSIAAPVESPPGFHEFDISDETLALRPDRGWHTRITKVTGGAESSRFAEPPTLIRESDGGGKTVGAETTAANMDGTAGKGLFNFNQRQRAKLLRVKGVFGAATNYTLSLVSAIGTLVLDSGTAVSSFLFEPVVPKILLPGEKLTLTTTVASNHKAEATIE